MVMVVVRWVRRRRRRRRRVEEQQQYQRESYASFILCVCRLWW